MKKLGSIVEAQQFDLKTLETIFTTADKMAAQYPKYKEILRGKIAVVLFYEPSTRTRFSFESAMKRLGGQVIGTESARLFSSKSKGESLEDTIRVASGYGDLIILRYDQEGGAKRASEFSLVPVINAGDGAGQHPTQALLDLYTIRKEFGKLEGLKIAIAGDLANGRTVRSLCYLLAKHYSKNEIFLVSPKDVRMKNDIKEFMNKYILKWSEHTNFDNIAGSIDIFYQTRIQKERFKEDLAKLERVKKAGAKLIINGNILSNMKNKSIIMHPLPRVSEISYEVDQDPRARYFEQAQNGLFVRMALLKMMLIGY